MLELGMVAMLAGAAGQKGLPNHFPKKRPGIEVFGRRQIPE